MMLFSKRYDYIHDNLRLVFNPDCDNYDFYFGHEKIPYEQLNRRTKKELSDNNETLKKDPNKLKDEQHGAKIKKRFQQLYNWVYHCACMEYLGIVNGTLSNEVKSFLNGLVEEENVLLGISRVGADYNDAKIQDAFLNGFLMSGHREAVACSMELKDNVSYYPDNATIIKELMYANQYKSSLGSFLFRIPDKDLEEGNIFIFDDGGFPRLKPEYIVGYVPVGPNHHIEKIIFNLRNYKNYSFAGNTCTIDQSLCKSEKVK